MAVLLDLHPDNAGGLALFSVILHARHRQLAGVIQRLGDVGHLDVPPDLAGRGRDATPADVVDAASQDQADRPGPAVGPFRATAVPVATVSTLASYWPDMRRSVCRMLTPTTASARHSLASAIMRATAVSRPSFHGSAAP